MSTQIATLGEVLVAILACEWSLSGVLPKVVPQVAGLLEDAPAARVHALEEQLLPLGHRVFDLDGLVPVRRDALEVLTGIF